MIFGSDDGYNTSDYRVNEDLIQNNKNLKLALAIEKEYVLELQMKLERFQETITQQKVIINDLKDQIVMMDEN